MGFGDSVSALLETYSNCLSLLKSLRHKKSSNDAAKGDDQQVTLLKSLKKDRALVEKAYSSRLSESGARLKKGDSRAISALDKILKKIRITVAKLLRVSSKEQKPMLDYDSLMSLSNTSRIEAIKTIDNLSRRLGSNNSSRVSTAYTTSTKPPSPVPRHKDRASHVSSQVSSRDSTSSPKPRNKSPASPNSPKKKRSSAKITKEESSSKVKNDHPAKTKDEASSKARDSSQAKPKEEKAVPLRPRPTVEFETPPSPPPKHDAIPQRRPAGIAQRVAAAADHRISFASFTSDSTKLGEIPERKSRSRYYVAVDAGADQYNVPPMYPLRPYKVEAKEKGFWGGLFGRKKED
ncbi:hypothetical protein QBC47DRAFT_396732 [Echria macrotheca]|uniref:Uncharacterized protein n=1 Tax=Echria macrotheca TaxID=438768 RepID=A0AAJ0BRM0_9PEZI|nr:hypothetical protein QBC47DRAFT_396732 [Echria macrotheca]